jgi:hypothetical protein
MPWRPLQPFDPAYLTAAAFACPAELAGHSRLRDSLPSGLTWISLTSAPPRVTRRRTPSSFRRRARRSAPRQTTPPASDGAPLFGQLGITAIPWPADDRGNAQGTVDETVPGHNGVITSVRDARAAGIVQELAPGETAIHSTGPDFDSLVLLKKQLAAIMVGDDCAIVMDRENKRFYGLVLRDALRDRARPTAS